MLWIDFKGTPTDRAGLDPCEEASVDTFRPHPWMITGSPGNCVEIVLPAAEPGVVVLQ